MVRRLCAYFAAEALAGGLPGDAQRGSDPVPVPPVGAGERDALGEHCLISRGAAKAATGHARTVTDDTAWYHVEVAMTLRLTDEQAEALRRRAEAEHRSMQQVALAAIDAYVSQPAPAPARREAVPTAELLQIFAGLPPMDVGAFRADQDRHVDGEAHFDRYERAYGAGAAE